MKTTNQCIVTLRMKNGLVLSKISSMDSLSCIVVDIIGTDGVATHQVLFK